METKRLASRLVKSFEHVRKAYVVEGHFGE